MDMGKSQRLVKYSNLIKDMVDYMEISGYLLQCQIISQTDHEKLEECVKTRGNDFAMEDLIHIIGLRRGGFSGFIRALHENDYIWLADQMELHQKDFTESIPTSKGIFPTIANGLKRRKSSRKSQRMSSETTFASYRQSMPIDFGATIPSQTDSEVTSSSSSAAFKFLSFPAKFISASLDNLRLVDGNQGPEASKSVDLETPMDDDCSSKIKSNYAIIYNIPEANRSQIDPSSDVKIVTRIAEEMKFPEKFLKGLKAVRVGRVSKEKSARPMKVKFRSYEARNEFISVMKNQTEVPQQDSLLAQLEVAPYMSDSKIRARDQPQTKGWWHQKRFLTLKPVKKTKAIK